MTSPRHAVLNPFVWDSRCILCPWYRLQWWLVKRNYSPPVWKTTWSDKWPVKINCLCHRAVLSNNITSRVVWQHGWLTAKSWTGTKGCSTVSTGLPCSIDLPVGHRPSFSLIPPTTPLSLAAVLDVSFHQASGAILTNQLPASCSLAPFEATGPRLGSELESDKAAIFDWCKPLQLTM